MKVRFVMDLDIVWLNEALVSVFDGQNAPVITEVNSDRSDDYLVVSSSHLTDNQAQAVFDVLIRIQDDQKHPCNTAIEIDLEQILKEASVLWKKRKDEEDVRAAYRESALKKLSKEEREALKLRE